MNIVVNQRYSIPVSFTIKKHVKEYHSFLNQGLYNKLFSKNMTHTKVNIGFLAKYLKLFLGFVKLKQ